LFQQIIFQIILCSKQKALLKATHSTSLRAGLLCQPFCFVHRQKLPLLKQKNRIVDNPVYGGQALMKVREIGELKIEKFKV
jgi:hypothetical protein